MLNMNVHPRPLNFLYVGAFNPVKPNCPSQFGSPPFGGVIEMTAHSLPETCSQSNIEHLIVERGEDIATGPIVAPLASVFATKTFSFQGEPSVSFI